MTQPSYLLLEKIVTTCDCAIEKTSVLVLAQPRHRDRAPVHKRDDTGRKIPPMESRTVASVATPLYRGSTAGI